MYDLYSIYVSYVSHLGSICMHGISVSVYHIVDSHLCHTSMDCTYVSHRCVAHMYHIYASPFCVTSVCRLSVDTLIHHIYGWCLCGSAMYHIYV